MEEAEDLLCEAGDIIDNAAFDLLNALSPERIDRKFAAQATCFSYGVSGDLEGFH